jgi:predicted membrane protein
MPTIAALALAVHVASTPQAPPTPLGLLHEPQPGWDDPDPAGDLGAEDPPGVPAPVLEPPPPQMAPQAAPEAAPRRPDVNKGTGLIIGASVTGGLAWVAGLSRMAIIGNCARRIEEGEIDGSAACIFRAGTASLILFPTQWMLNYATWGLAPAAGAIRGRYDGVASAYDGIPDRSAGAFIGSGAAVLGVGVIGRIIMYPMFSRALGVCVEDASKCMTHLQLQAFGVQMSAAMIGGGAGLLAYGIAYNSSSKKHMRLLEQHAIRFAPQIGWDYTGMGLSGQF